MKPSKATQQFFQFVVNTSRLEGFSHFLTNLGLKDCIKKTDVLGGVIVYYFDIFDRNDFKELKDTLNRYQLDFLH